MGSGVNPVVISVSLRQVTGCVSVGRSEIGNQRTSSISRSGLFRFRIANDRTTYTKTWSRTDARPLKYMPNRAGAAVNDATCHFRTKCTAANGGLFDELVDAAKKRKWNVKTECFGSLEIDD